jgi:sugar phosphate isomerase/epimerase
MKLGLYSITYLGIWYRGGAVPLADVFGKARELGYSGVEIDGKRPHGNPMDIDAHTRREIRAIATDQGLDIPAIGANNDFSSTVPEHQECQLLMVRELIALARDLGSPVVRLFLAWPGVTYRDGIASYDIARQRWAAIERDTPRYEIWDTARALFREASHIAENEGVTLALQNHGPVIRNHRDVIDMAREVDSPAFRICLDAPLLTEQDDESVRAAVRAVGAQQVHSHFGGEYVRGENGSINQRPLEYGPPAVNYATFVEELAATGYDGYLCYEFCHRAQNAKHELQGREYVDEQAALAREYLNSLLPIGATT